MKATVQRLQSHLGALSQPRNPYAHPEAHQLARDYLRGQLQAQGRRVLEQWFEAGEHGEGCNIIGYPEEPRQEPTFRLLAHYDTVTGSPGADDNGSAVAVALEVAARVPEIEVVFPDLEEVGLLGARHFVARDQRPNLPSVVLESVGYWSEEPGAQSYPEVLPHGFPHMYRELERRQFRGDFLALLHLTSDSELAERMEAALQGTGLRLAIPVELLLAPGAGSALRDFGRSDHLAFWEQGRPCLMLTDSANFRNPHYHRESDTAATLNFESMARLALQLQAFFTA